MDARGKFGGHERCVRVAENNFSFLSALQTSRVHPQLDIRTPKSMSKFFYHIADKNACFLIKNKHFYWLVKNTPQSSSLKENSFCKIEKKKIAYLIYSLTINGN